MLRLPGVVTPAFSQPRKRRSPAGVGWMQAGRLRLSKPHVTPETRFCLRVRHPCLSSGAEGRLCTAVTVLSGRHVILVGTAGTGRQVRADVCHSACGR